MNVDELRYFLEAAKEQNLSRAAQTLGITQSALSHAVRRLEGQFGCDLFKKKRKRVELTAHGKSFAIKAKEFVARFQLLKDEMSSPEAPLLGHFRIGAAPGEPLRCMAPAWNRLPYRATSVIELIGQRSAEVLEGVSTKKIEFGLCFNPQPYPNVISTPVARTDGFVMVRAAHPLLNVPKQKRVQSLSKYPLATPRHLPGTDPCSGHPVFKKLNSPPAIGYFFDSFDVAAETLLSSDAWAVLPKSELSRRPNDFSIIDKKSSSDIVLAFVRHEEDASSTVASKLIQALAEVTKDRGWDTLSSRKKG